MLVDVSLRIACEDFCGMALACVEGICSPCTDDAQCLAGELCVLDHCLVEELVGCRSYRDCGEDQLCILSGYTGGTPRANEDMRAYCSGADGGSEM